MKAKTQAVASGLLLLALVGCGDPRVPMQRSDGPMQATSHGHHHLHATDVQHDHHHPGFVAGAHEHDHEHALNESVPSP